VSQPAIGAVIADVHPPARMLELALLAERAGFSELWVCEDFFLGGGIATAASVLASTPLPVGLGITPATARHPAVLALELATLAGMFPGRLTAGLGTGIPENLDRIGMRTRSPLAAVADALRAVRTLLSGEPLNTHCESFSAEAVSLAHPPCPPPELYVGAGGPKMLRLSAMSADGTVLSLLSGPEYVKWARGQLTLAGALSHHRLVVYAVCAIAPEGHLARDMVREMVAQFALPAPRNPLSELQGFADEAEMLAKLGLERAVERLPERWLEQLTVAGTPDECAEKVHALLDAGADAVMLCFPDVDNVEEMFELAGRVLPGRVTVA
jgi:alkanesulfonate monooxygenase SsuD/methylene tetrahydromethanopterin reductase-like flavin-dependent oxidoreductase (luciferase family)